MLHWLGRRTAIPLWLSFAVVALLVAALSYGAGVTSRAQTEGSRAGDQEDRAETAERLLSASRQEITEARAAARAAEEEARAQQESTKTRQGELEAREESAGAKEAELAEREKAVSGQEAEARASEFGSGTHRVGEDIQPGQYRAQGGRLCYWARLSGFGGSFDEIIENHAGEGAAVVTIAPSDQGFRTEGCGTWTKV